MERTCKNYSTDGGDKMVIGGSLVVEAGASVIGIVGVAAVAANQAASTASTIAGAVVDLNALIAKLKTAGIITAD